MADETPKLPEIKFCPFCGGRPVILYHKGSLSIYCGNIDCVEPETGAIPVEKAVRRWNRRETK